MPSAAPVSFHTENNLFENGFLARTRQEELPGETGKKVWITQEIIDVSPEIRSGLEDIADPVQRYTEIQQRIKDRIAREEDPDKGIRCEIKTYYEGQYYYLLKYAELRDIRLVYAPPESIGRYGGDIDNWQWPRHTGDFTFTGVCQSVRQPAEYSPDTPYQPRHWRIADEPLEPDDLCWSPVIPDERNAGKRSMRCCTYQNRQSHESAFGRACRLPPPRRTKR